MKQTKTFMYATIHVPSAAAAGGAEIDIVRVRCHNQNSFQLGIGDHWASWSNKSVFVVF